MQVPPELPQNQPYNLNNELAKDRTRAAADRTLMAWMRTSLSLISFGFGIPTIVRAIEQTQIKHDINPERLSGIVGLAFIAVGVFGLATALNAHHRALQAIALDHYTYDRKASNATRMAAISLLSIGLVSFIGIIIKALNI